MTTATMKGDLSLSRDRGKKKVQNNTILSQSSRIRLNKMNRMIALDFFRYCFGFFALISRTWIGFYKTLHSPKPGIVFSFSVVLFPSFIICFAAIHAWFLLCCSMGTITIAWGLFFAQSCSGFCEFSNHFSPLIVCMRYPRSAPCTMAVQERI